MGAVGSDPVGPKAHRGGQCFGSQGESEPRAQWLFLEEVDTLGLNHQGGKAGCFQGRKKSQ